LISDIEVRSKQDKDKRINPLTPKKRYHFDFLFEDEGVIVDAGVLIAHALREAPNRPNQLEVDGMLDFLKKFLPMFFSLPEGTVAQKMSETMDQTDAASVAVEEDGSATPSRKGRKGGRPETNLLKDVLKRTRKSKDKPVRSTVASRESTPGGEASPNATPRETQTPFSEMDVNGDAASFADDDVAMNDADVEETEQEIQYAVKEAVETWIQPISTDVSRPLREGFSGKAVVPSENFTTREIKRHVFNLFGNNAIYCFFRMFQVLYFSLTV
jgi:histone deacetylase complex regulatory component SIN3